MANINKPLSTATLLGLIFVGPFLLYAGISIGGSVMDGLFGVYENNFLENALITSGEILWVVGWLVVVLKIPSQLKKPENYELNKPAHVFHLSVMVIIALLVLLGILCVIFPDFFTDLYSRIFYPEQYI